jgi:hypothetical protein
MAMSLKMDGWKVSQNGGRLKIVQGPCWAVVTYWRAYDGREVPDSHVAESLHRDRPELERLIEKYQYPAPGSVKQYDFAYGRMACATPYRESWESGYAAEPAEEEYEEFVFPDAEDEPGVEKVFRKVDIVRVTAAVVQDLYLDWARARILNEGDPPSLEFALHVLAEYGGEV